jgi:hypothetical protein
MTIYEIRMNVENYQYLLPANPEIARGQDLIFDCERRSDTWDPPQVYVGNPKAKRGNFFNFLKGDPYVCDQRAYEVLEHLFYPCAELLPLPFEGKTLYVINVLACLNILDEERSTFAGFLPKNYVFHPERMQQAPLFKIPRTSRSQLLTVEGFLDDDYDFKHCVERAGLEGLMFKKIWESR